MTKWRTERKKRKTNLEGVTPGMSWLYSHPLFSFCKKTGAISTHTFCATIILQMEKNWMLCHWVTDISTNQSDCDPKCNYAFKITINWISSTHYKWVTYKNINLSCYGRFNLTTRGWHKSNLVSRGDMKAIQSEHRLHNTQAHMVSPCRNQWVKAPCKLSRT
jgi:hypothetical protein